VRIRPVTAPEDPIPVEAVKGVYELGVGEGLQPPFEIRMFRTTRCDHSSKALGWIFGEFAKPRRFGNQIIF
jgi:hypothetical protein